MSEVGRLGFAAYLRLSVRSLRRNPGRTGLTLASLVVGIAALTFLGALNDGWLAEMKSNFILTLNGHLQVHGRGFEDSQSLGDLITDPDKVIGIVRADPAVAGWTLRLRTSGLAASASATAGMQVMGVDPTTEAEVTRMRECVDRGKWLAPGLPRAVLLGRTLAQNLGADLGDKVVLMAQRPDGEMASEVFYLRGTLCGGAPQVDRTLAVVPLDSAQTWLGVGASVSDVVIRASTHNAVDSLRDRLVRTLTSERYEVMRWQDLDPMVRQWLTFSDAYGFVVIFIVMALVVAEVLNTMLMALHERTRELAVMEALGARRFQLFHMVLIESVILVMGGALAGYLLGAIAVLGIEDVGVNLSRFSNAFQFFYMSPVIRPVLTTGSAVQIIGTTLVAAVLAGLYPAWCTRHINPVEALRSL